MYNITSIATYRTKFAAKFDLSETETAWYIARCWGSSEDQVAITNPIYFEGEDFKPPDAIPACVVAVVRDKDTNKTSAGECEVI